MPGAWLRSGAWIFALACAFLCAAATSRAQTSADSTATVPPPPPAAGPNPALAQNDSTFTPRYRFSPVFTNKMGADVSSVGMSNDFHTGFRTPWGSIFDFAISDDEKNYRLQNRVEKTKIMRLSDLHTFNLFWNGTASYSDSRVFNRSVALGGGVQDFIINDKQAQVGSTYKRTLMGARADMVGSAGAIESERTFKNDQGLQAGMNGGVGYTLIDQHLSVQGRGALRGSKDESSTIETSFNHLGSQEDSVMTGFHFQASDSIRFDAAYRRYNGDRDFADQARGSLGAQTSGAENVFEEHESRNTRNTTLSMASTLFSRFDLSLIASHDDQVYDYAIQKTRFSHTVGDDFSGFIGYTMPWKTVTKVTFDNSSTLRDYGSQSISSLTDKSKKVGVTATHRFTPTFGIDLSANTQLQQTFYLKYAQNPRDRDQADTNVNLRIDSQPFKKVAPMYRSGTRLSEFTNIDASQSSDNRSRELWELPPRFHVHDQSAPLDHPGVRLTFEYTDYDFKADQNFLDRNITFANTFQYHPATSIDLSFEYGLYLHDTGSYLPDPITGERLLDVSSKDRRDRTRVRVDYRFTKHVAFFGENLYSQREDLTPDNVVTGKTTDGQITVGTSGITIGARENTCASRWRA
jgi:hypothetical protein